MDDEVSGRQVGYRWHEPFKSAYISYLELDGRFTGIGIFLSTYGKWCSNTIDIPPCNTREEAQALALVYYRMERA